MMVLLRFIFLPLRWLVYLYYAVRNLRKSGDVLFHTLPDRFTMVRPTGILAYLAPRTDAHFIEYLALLQVFAESRDLGTLVYTVPDIEASWSEVEQLGRALQKIEMAGKKQLLAYSEGGNLKTLYLMSFARRRYAAPYANFVLNYPSTEGYFLKSTIARFGVTVETHHAGKFKAEGFEMFTRTGYSPAARKNLKELLGDFRARIDARFIESADHDDREAGRKLQQLAHKQILAETRDILNTGFFQQAIGAAVFEDWVRSGLVAGLPADPETAPNIIPPGEISEEVQHIFRPDNATGADSVSPLANPDDNAARATDSAESTEALENPDDELRRLIRQEAQARRRMTDEQALYNRHHRKGFPFIRLRSNPAVALVTMDGPISMGRLGDPLRGYGIAALPFRELIKDLGEGPEEAVFLHINSPGGGADASELLFDSIYRLSRVKPVFAVVGSVAASGGYYLACAANRIYASPLSILGSIGVIRIRPNLAGLYRKLGIKRESIFKDATRDLFSEAGPLTPASQRLMKQTMQSTYDLFLDRVARGRNQSIKEVSRQAEGRVFSGERFQNAHMIDGSLTFLEALDEYRSSLGYKSNQQFRLNFYPEVRADLRSLAGMPGGLGASMWSKAAMILNLISSSPGTVSPFSSREQQFVADLETMLQSPKLAYAPWQAFLSDL